MFGCLNNCKVQTQTNTNTQTHTHTHTLTHTHTIKLGNTDSFTNNMYYHKDRDQIWNAGPIWVKKETQTQTNKQTHS